MAQQIKNNLTNQHYIRLHINILRLKYTNIQNIIIFISEAE